MQVLVFLNWHKKQKIYEDPQDRSRVLDWTLDRTLPIGLQVELEIVLQGRWNSQEESGNFTMPGDKVDEK